MPAAVKVASQAIPFLKKCAPVAITPQFPLADRNISKIGNEGIHYSSRWCSL
ncbi:MAG: hypothetical protein IPP79_14885 [Chitinophagaceae bacterium]|nr:hypothetical protein [Chitinophagaceae bacterium]